MTETQQPAPLDLSWKTMTIQWGTRARVHKDAGLTLAATNVGAYGEIPDYWSDRTRSPRGAFNPTGCFGEALRRHGKACAEIWRHAAIRARNHRNVDCLQ